MKKIICLALVLIMTLSFAGCGADSVNEDSDGASANKWGVTLTCENVTPKGLTIVCKQSGGENVSELNTGTYYVIQKYENGTWTDLEYLPQEYDVVWASIALLIQKEGTTTWDVDWEWLYGELPAGEYRIGKEIMNFKDSGNHDKEMVYANFVIE